MGTTIQAGQQTVCPNYVNGEWVQSRSGQTLERRNPADLQDLIGYVPLSSREEMREAIEAAEGAREMWRDIPAPVRYFDEASSIDLAAAIKYALLSLWTFVLWYLHRYGVVRSRLFLSKSCAAG